MRNAKVLIATGQVLEFGYCDFTTASGWDPDVMRQVEVADNAVWTEPRGESKYTKVIDGQFVEMTPEEKAAIDAVTPVDVPQRIIVSAETIIADGGVDASTGFASVIGGAKISRPLKPGDYQLLVSFELALVGAAVWAGNGPDRAAQARLVFNGNEIQAWLHPFQQYTTKSTSLGQVVAEGATPSIDLQIRRLGSAGSARARRIRIELAPTVAAAAL